MVKKALILEDNPLVIKALEFACSPDSYELVQTSQAFAARLKDNFGLFFLDDEVPTQQGQTPSPHFLTNADLLLKENPESKIVYTGTEPSAEVKAFCASKGIEIIEKSAIGQFLDQ